jgi:DNA helicase-2/ATP-dependent DNA helicase PcrA
MSAAPADLFGDSLQTVLSAPADSAARPDRAARVAALIDDLNPQQRAAVVHEGGPLLVVAGAGSGKTRVLTRRIAYLLAARGVAPGEVLAITFTNKAAGEMKERVSDLVGGRSRAMWVSTFHSACVRILRQEAKGLGFTSSFTSYDSSDSPARRRKSPRILCWRMSTPPISAACMKPMRWISTI